MGDELFLDERYINERLNPQIKYYDKKSYRCQREFYGLSLANIIILAIIPVITLASDDFAMIKYIIAAASAVASILSSILLLKKSKDNWIEFRATCEALKAEREKYYSAAGPYKDCSGEERLSCLVERCESIMDTEHGKWSSRMKEDRNQSS